MAESIKILVVDDERDYAQLVTEFLRFTEAWRGATIEIATTYDAALRLLTAGAFDIAFFDYMLGSHDGLSLLREARRAGVDTPVIVLTGRGAEEIAVEAMKAGAADYLSKVQLTAEVLDRSVRLALALRQHERQRDQAERALRSSEERFRALVENSSDTLVLLDAEMRATYLTPSSQRHLGWKPDDMLGRSVFEFVHPRSEEHTSELQSHVNIV